MDTGEKLLFLNSENILARQENIYNCRFLNSIYRQYKEPVKRKPLKINHLEKVISLSGN